MRWLAAARFALDDDFAVAVDLGQPLRTSFCGISLPPMLAIWYSNGSRTSRDEDVFAGVDAAA